MNMDMDRVSKGMAIVGVVIIALAWILNPTGGEERKQFMRECQDSGMRHYQCIAMWRGGLSMLVLPVDVN